MTDGVESQLAAAIPDATSREKYVEFVDLMRLLADSVIANDYSIPDVMNDAIHLTSAGEAIMQKVATAKQDRVPAKEARLMCALAIGSDHLFVDIEATDLAALSASISAQIVDGRIRFPLTYGREAYDAFALEYEESKPLLTYEESQRFLDALPMGVHQYGRYVTGPFGLQKSASRRQITSGHRVEAFHCSDVMCDVVHTTYLTTSAQAAINRHREKFNEVLDSEPSPPNDWFRVADVVRDLDAVVYADAAVGVVAPLVGDGLSLEELRRLADHLLDGTSGDLRRRVGEFAKVSRASDYTATLDRASLLQIVLLAKEKAIHRAIDDLVDCKKIVVPAGEVRRPVVNRERRSGAFGLLPEVGPHGVRFSSHDPGFASLRLRHEITRVFNMDDAEEGRELEWHLRGIEGESLDERLDTFFRVVDPGECVTRLVLPSRIRVDRLFSNLRIGSVEGGDEEIVARVLWKIGYPLHGDMDPRAEFWRLHERFSGLTRAAHTPGARETEEFLGVAGKFFRELERYLSESLAFSAWALLNDHVQSTNPFVYGLEADHALGMSLVQEAFEESAERAMEFDFLAENLTIFPLVRGFGFLSKRLEYLRDSQSEYRRPEAQVPAYARGSKLKSFPFHATIPFLNLTDRSQRKVIEVFRLVSQGLQRGKVADVRNSHQHYRKSASGVEQIEMALREIELAMRSLEASGFGLVDVRTEDSVHDRWGRSEYYLSAPRGARHVVTRPSSYDWLGLPDLNIPQFVVTSAVFAEPNEVLRFSRRLDTEYTRMWEGVPNRRRPRGSALTRDGMDHAGAEFIAGGS